MMKKVACQSFNLLHFRKYWFPSCQTSALVSEFSGGNGHPFLILFSPCLGQLEHNCFFLKTHNFQCRRLKRARSVKRKWLSQTLGPTRVQQLKLVVGPLPNLPLEFWEEALISAKKVLLPRSPVQSERATILCWNELAKEVLEREFLLVNHLTFLPFLMFM